MPWLDALTQTALDADLDDPDSWVWSDITTYVRTDQPVSHEVKTGYDDESGDADKATCKLSLDMTDGKLAPRNPSGAWYGRLKPRNQPLRVVVRRVLDGFGRTSSAGWANADTGQAYSFFGIGGSIVNTQATVSGGVGRHSVPLVSGARATWLSTVALADVELSCTVTITGVSNVLGGNLEPANLLMRMQDVNTYYMARVEISAAEQVTCRLMTNTGGSFASAVVAGLTYSGQALRVVARVFGQTMWMKAWDAAQPEPAGWTIKADVPAANQLAKGAVGIRSGVASGNTNTLPVEFTYDDFQVLVPRFVGFVDEMPPRWDLSGRNRWAPVVVSGITRRLLASKQLRSSLYRRITSRDNPQPIQYWPCEEPEGAELFASAITGAPPLVLSGDAEVSSYRDFEGSAPLPVLTAAKMAGEVPRYTNTGLHTVRWALHLDAAYAADADLLEVVFRSGPVRRWVVRFGTAGDAWQRVFGPTDAVLLDSTHISFSIPANRVWAELTLDQNGANLDWAFWIYKFPAGASVWSSGDTASGTLAGVTLGTIKTVRFSPARNCPATAIGHVLVANDDAVGSASIGPGSVVGWRGEQATNRVSGMTHDALVPVLVEPAPNHTAMIVGPQPASSTLISNLRDSAAAAGALLHDSRAIPGLRYVPLGYRTNRATDLLLDSTQLGEPLEPTDDDQQLATAAKADRPGGSSAVFVDETAQVAEGVYEKPITRNVNADAQLPHQASWAVGLGGVQEPRVPKLSLNLRATPALIDAWLCTAPGARVTVNSPPAGMPPAPIEQQMIGSTERLGPFLWEADLVCVPELPYEVFEVESSVGNRGRVDTAGSVVAKAAGAADTTLSVATVDGPLWSHSSGDFDIDVRGERMTVTAVADAITDTFTRVVAGGFGSTDTGEAYTLTGAAADHSVTGTVGRIVTTTINGLYTAYVDTGSAYQTVRSQAQLGLVPTGAGFTYRTNVRLSDASNYIEAIVFILPGGTVQLQLFKRVANVGASISSLITIGTHAAGNAWRTEVALAGSVVKAKAWNASTGSEPAGYMLVADVDPALPLGTNAGFGVRRETGNTNGATNVDFDNFSVTSPQDVTVVRGVGGTPAIAHPVGAPVALWRGPRWSL